MKKLILILALASLVSLVNAQTWTQYTTANGLAGNNIHAIAIDNQGNKWFGTYGGGVSKFDGINWTTYTTADGLCDNNVHTLYIDSHENIWIGAGNKVSKFDGINWTSWVVTDTTMGMYVCSSAQDLQGNMWFGTYYSGVYKFDGVNWTNYTTTDGLPDNYVPSIAVDFQGNIWFGTYGAGIAKYDGINWTTYNTSDGLGSNFPMAVCIDAQGDIWCTNHDALSAPISRFDGYSWSQFPIPGYLDSWGDIGALAIDILGNKWLGTDQNAIKFDGLSWINFLSGYDINAIAIDMQGNKWIGTLGDGVWKLSDGGAIAVSSSCVIEGNVFNDINGNGIKDNGEVAVQGKMVEVINESIFSITQSNGNYYVCRDTGTYHIKCIPGNYFQYTTDSIVTVHVSDTSTIIDNIDFGIRMLDGINDASVDITGNAARPNFNVKYWLNYKNEGNVTKNGTVVLNKDPLTTFVSSVPAPDAQNGNTITWNYSNLVSLEQRQIQLFLYMPGVSQLGQTLTETAIINPIGGDIAPTNNYDTLGQVVTGSYDPNDKAVDKGTTEYGLVLFGEELTYTIRFQNTGTDTAFTVQIRDTIDSDMDVASLRIVSASHNVRLDVKGNNIVTFIFDNILLPDSGANEDASCGYIKFAIKPKSGLAENTEVVNNAYIYFDFNPAIVTNDVLNTYVSVIHTAIQESSASDDKNIVVYPNPATNSLTIATSYKSTIQILNIQGQLISTFTTSGNNTTIDVSSFPGGLYFIKVITDRGIAVRKFVKE
jgi:uncharacterized repeat protein (TIGR01451 family)